MSNNKEWDGTGLPPVGVECEIKRHDWTDWQIGKFTFIGSTLAVFESESRNEAVCDVERVETRPLQPQPKKIDMAKFAGSDVLIESGDVLFIADNDSIRALKGRYCEPIFNYWNHWTGDTKPEWLEPFNVTVRETMVSHCGTCVEIVEHKRNVVHWPNVVAIRFDSLKEGWE